MGMSMTDIICYLLTILEDELPPDEAGELLLVHVLGVARHVGLGYHPGQLLGVLSDCQHVTDKHSVCCLHSPRILQPQHYQLSPLTNSEKENDQQKQELLLT